MANIDTLNSQLAAVGDAIRAKLETQDTYKISEMPDAIASISGGGGVTQPLTMTEIKPYTPSTGVDGFSSVTPQLDLVATLPYAYGNTFLGTANILSMYGYLGINNYINSITIKVSNMAPGLTIVGNTDNAISLLPKTIIDFNHLSDYVSFQNLVNGISRPSFTNLDFSVQNYESITNLTTSGIMGMFCSCYYLTNISNNVKNFIITLLNRTVDNGYTFPNCDNIFFNCYNLREDDFISDIINIFMRSMKGLNTSSSSAAYRMISNAAYCRKIEIEPFYFSEDITTPPIKNLYLSTLGGLKHFIFKNFNTTNLGYRYNGITIDLSNVGVVDSSNYLNSNKLINSYQTYYTLKDDPDAWTTNTAYSFYNHDSAVETINSLPDMTLNKYTTTQKCRIYFTGSYGSATDGGAINTMTAEEIAVATNKGWTVTLV